MKKNSKKVDKTKTLPLETAETVLPEPTEVAPLGDKEVPVIVIDEIADALKAEPTEEKIWIKLLDTGSCWGVGKYHLANRQVKQVPFDNIVRLGIRDKAIVQITEQEANDILAKK